MSTPYRLSKEQFDAIRSKSAKRVHALRAAIRNCGSALVAFSGGVDSTFLLKITAEELGDNAVALTALSASMALDERIEVRALCLHIGAKHIFVDAQELEDPRYTANSPNRCYFCKSHLYRLTEAKRSELGLSVVFNGSTLDDEGDFRPGHRAAREYNVISPLTEAALTKSEIRAWSHYLGLPTWHKPQTPCLASRLPYGTQVTSERLRQIDNAERQLKALGFVHFRVRYHKQIARIEIAAEEWHRFFDPAIREQLNKDIQAAGFAYVVLDLEPFRSGRLNDMLKNKQLKHRH